MDIQPLRPAPSGPVSRPETPPAAEKPDRVTLEASPPAPGLNARQAAEILSRDRGEEGIEVLWTQRFEARKAPGNYLPVRLEDGTLVVNGQEGTYGLHPDGSPAWHLDTGNCAYRAPVAGPRNPEGQVLYLRSDDGSLIGVQASAREARVLWKKPIGTRGTSAAPVVGADGRLYVADNDRRLWILGPDGTPQGHVDGEDLMSEEPALQPDGRLVLQGYGGAVAEMDPHARTAGLRRLWKSEEPRLQRVHHGDVLQPTGIGPDGAAYEVRDGQDLRVLEPDGKTVRWEHPLSEKDSSVHVTLRPDGTAYALSGCRLLTAISPQGQELWTWKVPEGVAWNYTLDPDGTAYFTGEGGNWNVYAVDKDGHQKWATPLQSHGADARLGPKNTLLVGGDMHPLRVLDRATGKVLGEQAMRLAFGNNPVLALEDGSLFAATEDGSLVGLRLRTQQDIKAEIMQDAATAAGPPEAPPEIQKSSGFVVIGGVSVPVKR